MYELSLLSEYKGKNIVAHYVFKSKDNNLMSRLTGGDAWHRKFLCLDLKQPTGPVVTYSDREHGDENPKRIFLSVSICSNVQSVPKIIVEPVKKTFTILNMSRSYTFKCEELSVFCEFVEGFRHLNIKGTCQTLAIVDNDVGTCNSSTSSCFEKETRSS